MINIRKDYASLQKPVLYAISAEFFIQLISNALLYILPLYMHTMSYTDGQVAGFVSYRFLAIVLITIPLGFFIKGRKLKGFFITTGICTPILTLLSIKAIALHIGWLICLTQFLTGFSSACFSVSILPFILRNERAEHITGAISLRYAEVSLGAVISGLIIGFLNTMNPYIFNEERALIIIGFAGMINLYFLWKIKNHEYTPVRNTRISLIEDFDWKIIWYALIPNILIAIGAGLAIPFIGLFFAHVHNMSTGVFALVNSAASALIVVSTLFIPFIKRTMGMRSAITWIQVMAVFALVLLATTQYYNTYAIGLIIAIGAYLLRNPLMNMVGPLTAELSMSYVGGRNQEIVSALMSAITSGGYYVSVIMFKQLRDEGVDYASIFYITAGLYLAGILFYDIIARKHIKNKGDGI
ncbi:MAG TPA: MFS transporter [Bacteroidia bacterium]|nr:MFS transporter [Bacteroidia bacterium]